MTSEEVLIERVERMQRDITDISQKIDTLSKDVTAAGLIRASLLTKIEDHDKRLEAAEEKIVTLDRILSEMRTQSKIYLGLAGLLGSSLLLTLLSFLWSILTHQVNVVTP